MTNTFPTPTSAYSNDNTATDFDFFSSKRGGLYSPSEPLYAPRQRVWKVDRNNPNVYGWEIVIEDLRGGIDVTQNYFDKAYNKTYWATGDTRFPGAFFLPTIANTSTPTDFANEIGIHHALLSTNLAIGVGSTANSCLFTPTSASDPTPSARTFSPGSAITGIWPVVLNNIQYLAIGRASAAAYLISDLAATPTSPGTMHADTNPTWGIIQTPLPGSPILVYAGTSIYNNLNAASAIGAAVTASNLTNVPAGGFAIGIASLGGGPYRAFWAFPILTSSGGGLASTMHFRIMHCNFEGTDLQELTFPMRGIWSACVYRDGIVATDSAQVYWHRGTPINLRWGESRDPYIGVGGTYPYIQGLRVDGDTLAVECFASSGSAGLSWAEAFDLETGRWNMQRQAATTGGLSVIRGSGSLPYNPTYQVAYSALGGASSKFQWQYIPSFGKRPQTTLRDLAGVTIGTDLATSFQGYEQGASWWGPLWELRGLEGWPKVVSEILHPNDNSNDSATGMVSASGTPLITVRVTGAPITITSGVPQTTTNCISAAFGATSTPVTQVMPIPGSNDARGAFRVEITLARGTDSDRTPNGLPVIIRGFAYAPGWARGNQPKEGNYGLAGSV